MNSNVKDRIREALNKIYCKRCGDLDIRGDELALSEIENIFDGEMMGELEIARIINNARPQDGREYKSMVEMERMDAEEWKLSLLQAKVLVNHISKPETLSEEEIISIIKGSELWRMSNYCGRDKVFGEDKYTGTEMLAKSLVGHIPRKQEGLCPKCNRQVSAVLCHCGKQEVKLTQSQIEDRIGSVVYREISGHLVVTDDIRVSYCLTQSQIDAICAAEGYTREMLKEKKQEVSLQQIQNILLESINEEGKCSTRDMAERIHGFLYKPEGSEKI